MTPSNQENPEPTEENVRRLANAWMPFAKSVEEEITVGWDGIEPTRLVRRVSAYLAKHDPEKGRVFDKQFLGILD
ncbi:hypothetical protein [Comamonas testosteroni]|uniref:hypothetical protein n=1 Tax=Comamonas testosteroni TaxID=285 RepID=UPI0012D36B32|nr:hypothetical protein [Comamonas testosteroni]